MSEKARTCVVVSYWTGRPPTKLLKLLRRMRKVEAGSPFELVIVVNGGDRQPLSLPSEFDAFHPRIFNRENTGWNLGAWDHGWREAGDYEYFLFLQDDCFLKRPGWVSGFEFRFDFDLGIGLLGEEILWDQMSWPFIMKSTDRDFGELVWDETEHLHPIEMYRLLMIERGVSPGGVGTHLPSLVLFTSRRILEDVGGFPLIGSTYREAVACEIGLSRLIASNAYRIARVKERSFHYIGHPQWTRSHAIRMQIWQKTRSFLKKLGLRKPKHRMHATTTESA